MPEFEIVLLDFPEAPGDQWLTGMEPIDTFKIQAHAMFLDTTFNSFPTVISNVYSAFIETATKMWTYTRCLPTKKQPGTKLVISE